MMYNWFLSSEQIWIHPVFSVQGGGQQVGHPILSAIHGEDQELTQVAEPDLSGKDVLAGVWWMNGGAMAAVCMYNRI